jgi:hypothetical protein
MLDRFENGSLTLWEERYSVQLGATQSRSL